MLDDLVQQLRAVADELERRSVRGVAADPLGGVERASIAEEVASVLRHDLRNNLASIRNAAFYLKRRTRETELWTTDPRMDQFFTLIDEMVVSSTAALEERLDLKRLFTRRAALVSARACVERAVGCARLPATVEVAVDAGEGDVEVDVSEVALGIRCLLENAAEATADGGRVTISTRVADEQLLVEVRDDGPGIPEDARVFEPFRSTKDGRAGLGLNIARRIARRYGGNVERAPAPSGACLVLSLPLAAAPEPRGAAELTILLVDDSVNNLFTMSALLEGEGFRVDTASSVATALAAIEAAAAPYDVALLDHRLGDGRGTDLLPVLRARMPSTKVVLLSGFIEEDGAEQAGFDACVSKGTGFTDILALLRRMTAPASVRRAPAGEESR